MEYLLDEVITLAYIEAKTGQKYISLTKVMKKSDDISLNAAVSRLMHNLVDQL